ncbi:MAG TPA: chromosome partitioning protein ParB, partial [Solirubrobacteraceae bacterium]|nr:chromosome partitioning protein ParB [Solirubrobacteraceae bacterium]
WSVRVLEQRARAANETEAAAPKPARTPDRRHPDQDEACATIADALGTALGADVRVIPARDGSYRAELRLDSVEDALALAEGLRPRQRA